MSDHLTAFLRERYEEDVGMYCNFMVEIKRRCESVGLVINQTIDGNWPLDDRMAEDFCYMNFRMCCELIALSCLLAHGDIKDTKGRLRDIYQADAIIKAMSKLHPNFYPRPGKVDMETRTMDYVDMPESEYLTRQDLLTLYFKCSEYLHVGKFRDLPKVWARKVDMSAVFVWHAKLVKLLDQHIVSTVDPFLSILVVMQAADKGLQPTATLSIMKGHALSP